MRKQQSGFTLIELVVVIVILGILAAAAIPRFADLTGEARVATADGVIGAVLSSAVIQLGANQGASSPFVDIIANTGISPANNTIFANIAQDAGNGFEDITGTIANECADGTPSTLQVVVCPLGAADEVAAGCTVIREGIIPEGLCVD